MNLVLSNVSNPIRVYLDAPYRDGVENIKAALWPNERRLLFSFWRLSIPDRIIDLSKRLVQFGIGVVLIIPVVNVIVHAVVRFFPYMTHRQMDEPLDTVNYAIKGVIKRVLPRILEFLDENEMKESSIYYECSLDYLSPPFIPSLRFIIDLKNNNKIDVPIVEHASLSEQKIFDEIKQRIEESVYFH